MTEGLSEQSDIFLKGGRGGGKSWFCLSWALKKSDCPLDVYAQTCILCFCTGCVKNNSISYKKLCYEFSHVWEICYMYIRSELDIPFPFIESILMVLLCMRPPSRTSKKKKQQYNSKTGLAARIALRGG